VTVRGPSWLLSILGIASTFATSLFVGGCSGSASDAVSAGLQQATSSGDAGLPDASAPDSGGGRVVPSAFFGIDLTEPAAFPQNGQGLAGHFGALRFWDTGWGTAGAQWPQVEVAEGSFAFDVVDQVLADLKRAGITEAFYTLSRVPSWASSQPDDPDCDYYEENLHGECDLPGDVLPDGTGTNARWRAWVARIATHVVHELDHNSYATIKYWEPWNEFGRNPIINDAFPYVPAPHGLPISIRATYAQLVRLTEDTNCIITGRVQTIRSNGNEKCSSVLASVGLQSPVDPSAVIVAPSAGDNPDFYPGAGLNTEQNLLYCDGTHIAGDGCTTGDAGANAVDVINFHMYAGDWYSGKTPLEKNLAEQVGGARSILHAQELSKPLWSGEGSWSLDSDYPNVDNQAAYVARYHLLGWSLGMDAMYWYSYGAKCGGYGTLWCQPTGLTKAGQAWVSLYDWIVGTSMSPCTANGTVWTCNLAQAGTIAGTTAAEILWDSDPRYYCGTTCPTHSYPVPDQFAHYEELDGTNGTIAAHTIALGIKPVLIR
jgi:hypothetical protein